MNSKATVLAKSSTAAISDSLQNVMSGLLTERDKSYADEFVETFISDSELSAMYRNDWVSQKIVNVPANDMVREWRTWQGDKDQASMMLELEKSLDLVRKVKRAKQWQRLFGGAGMIIGDGSNDPKQPLDIENFRKNQLRYLHVVSKKRLRPTQFETNIDSPNFENPNFFDLQTRGDTVQIHHTRVIAFRGVQAPDTNQEVDWWGDSVLRAVYDAIRHAARAAGGFAALIDDAITDKVKTPSLNDALSNPDDEARFKKRYQLAQTGKSLFKMLLLGEDEEWERSQINFTNFEPILMAFLQIVSGASDIPATRMLGQSPKGLNATGESDLRNYYDMISSRQQSDLGPEMHLFDRIMMMHLFGSEPDGMYASWNKLWQETPKDKSETNLNNAKAAQVHALLGVFDSEVLRKSVESQLIETEVYPGLESALEDIGNEDPDPLDFDDPDDDEGGAPAADKALNDATPMPLYVSRPVKNADEIIKWAKDQGFNTTLKADDMHVTIAFSRKPVDWFKMSEESAELEIEAGGPRMVEKLGDKGAVVLLVNSHRLKWRHREMLDIGGSHDFEEYQPHITLTYSGSPPLDSIEPYRGPIILGPEKFELIDDGWRSKVIEDAKAREE